MKVFEAALKAHMLENKEVYVEACKGLKQFNEWLMPGLGLCASSSPAPPPPPFPTRAQPVSCP
jgi:hypothetical protein